MFANFERLKESDMKKLALIITTLLLSVSVFAQEDVTKFLGIPVDGFKPEMIKKLKAKGYTEHPYKADVLVGEFNGADVEVSVVTDNNKVYRIFLEDRYSLGEADIKIRFNTLCRQFENNAKYATLGEYTIPDTENISYEMSVNKKRYEAAFYQKPEKLDTLAMQAAIFEKIRAKYTQDQIANPTEEITEDLLKMAFDYSYQIMTSKFVWFMIVEDGSRYKILMFYDNKHNQANGEDL